jgi:hypothetical protein
MPAYDRKHPSARITYDPPTAHYYGNLPNGSLPIETLYPDPLQPDQIPAPDDRQAVECPDCRRPVLTAFDVILLSILGVVILAVALVFLAGILKFH